MLITLETLPAIRVRCVPPHARPRLVTSLAVPLAVVDTVVTWSFSLDVVDRSTVPQIRIRTHLGSSPESIVVVLGRKTQGLLLTWRKLRSLPLYLSVVVPVVLLAPFLVGVLTGSSWLIWIRRWRVATNPAQTTQILLILLPAKHLITLPERLTELRVDGPLEKLKRQALGLHLWNPRQPSVRPL